MYDQEVANAAHRMLLRNIVAMLIRLDVVDSRQCQAVIESVISAVGGTGRKFDADVAAYMRLVFNDDIWDKMSYTQDLLNLDGGRKDN